MKTNVQKCDFCGVLKQSGETGWIEATFKTRNAQLTVDVCPKDAAEKTIAQLGELVVTLTTPAPKVMPSKPATPIAQPAGGK